MYNERAVKSVPEIYISERSQYVEYALAAALCGFISQLQGRQILEPPYVPFGIRWFNLTSKHDAPDSSQAGCGNTKQSASEETL